MCAERRAEPQVQGGVLEGGGLCPRLMEGISKLRDFSEFACSPSLSLVSFTLVLKQAGWMKSFYD